MSADAAGLLEDSAEELFEQAPCGYLSWLPDGRIVKVNGTFRTWSGYTRDELVGRRRITELLTAGGQMFYDTHYLPLLHMQGWVREIALDLVRRDGSRLPILMNSIVKRSDAGEPLVIRTSVFDATERTGYERELLRSRRKAEQSESRVRFLHEVTAELVTAVDAGSAVDVLVRAATRSYRGASAAVWLLDADGTALVRSDDPGTTSAMAPPIVQLRRPLPLTKACREQHVVVFASAEEVAGAQPALASAAAREGVQAQVCVPLVAQGQVLGAFQLTFRRPRDLPPEEVTMLATLGRQVGQAIERSALSDRLRHLALHDALTGVPNRTLLEDRLEQALVRAERSGEPLTLMFLDLDGFKPVNDSLGHRAGDDVLVAVAGRLVAGVRPADTVARMGGDEFALLLEGVDLAEARRLAQVLEGRVREPVPTHGSEVAVTASVGIVVHSPADGRTTARDLLRDADDAVHLAKTQGKDRHQVYDRALRSQAVQVAATKAALHRALTSDGLVLHYQPVFDLADGTVRTTEALCRVQDGDSLLMPATFIPVAEESGLIVPLGEQVLRLACEQLVRWDAEGRRPVRMAVNVAADQAAQPGFAEAVLTLLAGTGCRPERLVLELTESVLLLATPTTLAGLDELRQHGVGIALDDFGTRYASLNYVQQFPLTGLKIDRSFVSGLPTGLAERAIVQAVAQLARDLGVTCTAEGIETPEQEAFLRGLGGVWGQGYLLSRPVPPEECARLL